MAALQFSVGGERMSVQMPTVAVNETSGVITVSQTDNLPSVPYGVEQAPLVATPSPVARKTRAAHAPQPSAVA